MLVVRGVPCRVSGGLRQVHVSDHDGQGLTGIRGRVPNFSHPTGQRRGHGGQVAPLMTLCLGQLTAGCHLSLVPTMGERSIFGLGRRRGIRGSMGFEIGCGSPDLRHGATSLGHPLALHLLVITTEAQCMEQIRLSGSSPVDHYLPRLADCAQARMRDLGSLRNVGRPRLAEALRRRAVEIVECQLSFRAVPLIFHVPTPQCSSVNSQCLKQEQCHMLC